MRLACEIHMPDQNYLICFEYSVTIFYYIFCQLILAKSLEVDIPLCYSKVLLIHTTNTSFKGKMKDCVLLALQLTSTENNNLYTKMLPVYFNNYQHSTKSNAN